MSILCDSIYSVFLFLLLLFALYPRLFKKHVCHSEDNINIYMYDEGEVLKEFDQFIVITYYSRSMDDVAPFDYLSFASSIIICLTFAVVYVLGLYILSPSSHRYQRNHSNVISRRLIAVFIVCSLIYLFLKHTCNPNIKYKYMVRFSNKYFINMEIIFLSNFININVIFWTDYTMDRFIRLEIL